MAYLTGSGSPWNALRDPARAEILGCSFISDGTPMITRSIGLVKGASSPNAAKLMIDVSISREGQKGWALGQRTPLRPDVTASDVGGAYTYSKVVEEVGQENLVVVGYDDSMVANYDDFMARWRNAFGIG